MMVIEADEQLTSSWKRAAAALESQGAVAAIWGKNPSLWSSEAAAAKVIDNRLGWLHVGDLMRQASGDIAAFLAEVHDAGFRQAVLLGMGGSSLAPEVFSQVFGRAEQGLELFVLDTTDPVTVAHVEAHLDLAHTLFIVSSKSGGTIEPNSLLAYFWEQVGTVDAAGRGQHFIAITDPGTSLEGLARARNFRKVFLNPSDIGGRYSALSFFGLVPAALSGIDVERLLARAETMAQACHTPEAANNPGLHLGVALGAWANAGLDKLTLLADQPLTSLGMWLEQLIAESTGKLGKGIVPIDHEPLGAATVYGGDRVFVQIYLRENAAAAAAQAKSLPRNAPLVRIELADRYDLAQEFFRWEFATAVAGAVLGINPFDEPNVKESKDNTTRVIQQFVSGGALEAGLEASPDAVDVDLSAFSPEPLSVPSVENALQSLLESVETGDYLALMAYFEATTETQRELQKLRTVLRDGLHCATTLGFGPRFLHSTGQLHKGGANNGVFLQLTATPGEDRPIPGQPYTFSTLIAAQALGDYQSLASHHRRLLRLDLGKEVPLGLRQLTKLCEQVLAARAKGLRA